MAYYVDVNSPVIVDNSDIMIRAGLTTDDSPRAVFPAVVGRPRYSGAKVGIGYRDYYCGDDALAKRGILTLQYPAEFGIITNWDDMEKLWHYTFFDVLKHPTEEHAILLTEAPLTPENDREKVIQMMFESFKAPAVYVAVDAVLALYAAGLKTGMVLQSTGAKTYAVPILEGKVLSHAILTLDIGGRSIAEYMAQMLTERGYSLTSTASREIVGNIVDELDYIALDFDREMAESTSGATIDRQYELPDGDIITVGSERFRAPEVLFKPDLIGMNKDGIARMVHDSIMKCDANIQATLFSNIVLAGSNTMFSGIAERLTKEITAITPPPMKVNVVAPPDRKNSTWIGGALLTRSATFNYLLISRQEYDDSGPGIGHR